MTEEIDWDHRWRKAAVSRMRGEDVLKHGTSFCAMCNWRTGGMAWLCNLCYPCDKCTYPKSNCHCNNERFKKHLKDCEQESGLKLT
jgi:hypothetical protein